LKGGRVQARSEKGKLRGRAVSFYIEFGGIFNDRMEMRFDPSGACIYGGPLHGQGHATVFAQLAREFLGVPFEHIKYVQGDTAQVAIGRGTYAARSATVGGNALRAAALELIEKGKKLAAAMMEADAADIEFKDGEYQVTGTIEPRLVDVASLLRPDGALTGKFGIGLDSTGSFIRRRRAIGQQPRLRARGRSGDRRGDHRALHRGRRSRPRAQPDDRVRPAARRPGAGHRPGADGAPGL
jgi:carbon-monoxide dehydrogenase large subunit